MELPKVRRLSFRGFHNPFDMRIDRDFMLGRDPWDDVWQPKRGIPPVNIKQNEKHYELEMPLPGYKREEISIRVENDILTISGKRESESTNESEYIIREHVFDSFERSFELGTVTDEDRITARFADGVLHVTLPHIESLPYVGEPQNIAIM